jgi:hypothetical protein
MLIVYYLIMQAISDYLSKVVSELAAGYNPKHFASPDFSRHVTPKCLSPTSVPPLWHHLVLEVYATTAGAGADMYLSTIAFKPFGKILKLIICPTPFSKFATVSSSLRVRTKACTVKMIE